MTFTKGTAEADRVSRKRSFYILFQWLIWIPAVGRQANGRAISTRYIGQESPD